MVIIPTPILSTLFNFAGPDLLVMTIPLLIFGFVIWMIIDCASHETSVDNMKLIWILVIIFVPLGSLVYFFARKLRRSPQRTAGG
jgi:hypothetical protein